MPTTTEIDTEALVVAIASRAYNASELMQTFGLTKRALLAFRDAHIGEIEKARLLLDEQAERDRLDEELAHRDISLGPLLKELSTKELTDLWSTRKSQRILRYQMVIDMLFLIRPNEWDSTVIREIRSYLGAIAEELGQIPNRGSATDGEDTKATYEIVGVHPDELR